MMTPLKAIVPDTGSEKPVAPVTDVIPEDAVVLVPDAIPEKASLAPVTDVISEDAMAPFTDVILEGDLAQVTDIILEDAVARLTDVIPEMPPVPVTDFTEETVAPVDTDVIPEDKIADGEKENEEGVECGFLVDKISTTPYQKAISRGEVPFCAFSPISTQDLYLLRIQDCSDSTRHMLVPASKEDVFNTPGALKSLEEQEPGNDNSLNYRVAIVAIARQMYNEQEKQLLVSVDPPLKKDKDRITCVKFLTLDKFADFAFLGFDGDISEFVKGNEPKEKIALSGQDILQSEVGTTTNCKTQSSPPLVPPKQKSPPRAPARRGGRGGRRRASRKSPHMPSPTLRSTQQRQLAHSSQNFSMQMLPPLLSSEIFGDISFVKMEQPDFQAHQYLSQFPVSHHQIHDSMMFSQDNHSMPPTMDMPVPMPVKEVTVSTSEPGVAASDEHTNHDIITIALDQLIPMTSGGDPFNHTSNGMGRSERGSRGGRRPGRKPGRKPTRDRAQFENDENSMPGRVINSDGSVPKRRGRPPKNRPQLQAPGQDEEISHIDGEDFGLLMGKRIKLQVFD